MDTNDTSGRLSAVGLSELEERVYRELVRRGGATLAEVTDSTGVSSRRAQEALAAVEAMGLLTRSAKRPTCYTPTPPQSAIEVLIRGRQEELEQVAAAARQLDDELHSNAAGVVPKQPVEVLAPGEGLAGLNRHLLASASKEILGFQTPPLTPLRPAHLIGIALRGRLGPSRPLRPEHAGGPRQRRQAGRNPSHSPGPPPAGPPGRRLERPGDRRSARGWLADDRAAHGTADGRSRHPNPLPDRGRGDTAGVDRPDQPRAQLTWRFVGARGGS